MGGFGSGRRKYAATPTVKECHSIEINDLSSLAEHPGEFTIVRWFDGDDRGDEVASVAIRALKNGQPMVSREGSSGHGDIDDDLDGRATCLQLEYIVTTPSGETEEYEYRVRLEYTPVHFGGVRPWFQCPECYDRVGKLHRPPSERLFQCRECFDLGYLTSRVSGNKVREAELRYRRLFEKADAKDRRPHPNSELAFPERPKGMHHETFDRICMELEKAKAAWGCTIHARCDELHDLMDNISD